MKKITNGLQRFLASKKAMTVLSFVLAVIVWFVIANTIENQITRDIVGIQIDLSEQIDTLANLGLKISEVQNVTAAVKVTGARSLVGGLGAKDILVTASLTGVSSAGTYDLRLNAVKKDSGQDYQILDVSPSTIRVSIDRQGTKTFEPAAKVADISVPQNYLMEQYYVTPGELTITASNENLAKIDHVEVEIDAGTEPLTKTTIFDGRVVLYDSQGQVIPQDNYIISTEHITVTVVVLKQKTLALTVAYTHVPAGLDTDSIQYIQSSSSILVAGPEDEIDSINEIFLGYIDMRTLTPGSTFNYDVVLPDGFLNIKNVNSVILRFSMDDYGQTELKTSNINLLNKPANYDVEVLTESISNITVVGPAERVQTISSEDLIAELDLSNYELSEGQYNLGVDIVLPGDEGVWAVGSYSVVVVVSQK